MQKRAKTSEMRADDKTHRAQGGETQAAEAERGEEKRTEVQRDSGRWWKSMCVTVAPVSNLRYVGVLRQASLEASLPLNGPEEYAICALSSHSFTSTLYFYAAGHSSMKSAQAWYPGHTNGKSNSQTSLCSETTKHDNNINHIVTHRCLYDASPYAVYGPFKTFMLQNDIKADSMSDPTTTPPGVIHNSRFYFICWEQMQNLSSFSHTFTHSGASETHLMLNMWPIYFRGKLRVLQNKHLSNNKPNKYIHNAWTQT